MLENVLHLPDKLKELVLAQYHIFNRLSLAFNDRESSAKILVTLLRPILRAENDLVILGIPSGGAILADGIFRRLPGSYFDLIISKKLESPSSEEMTIGAVMGDGFAYLDHSLLTFSRVTKEYIDSEISERRKEILIREKKFRQGRVLNNYDKIRGKTVIVVDDVALSGSTLIVTLRWLKERWQPKCLIAAVLVAPKETVRILEKEANCVVAVITPHKKNFASENEYIHNFEHVTDEQIISVANRNFLMI